MKDTLTVTGKIHFVQSRDGKIILDEVVDNLVVTTGKNFIASRIASASANVMSYIAVGVEIATPTVGDTALGSELIRVATTVAGGTVSANTVTWVINLPAGVGTGSLGEAGIFNAATSGTMLSRATFPVIPKGAADTLQITWTITVN